MLNLNEEIEPMDLAFENHKIGIVYASSKEFAKYTAASILSIAKNSSDQDKYDIIILHQNFEKKHKDLFERVIGNKQNFSIRFYEAESKIEPYKFDYLHYGSDLIYYKLLIPDVCKKYDKIIYLGADTTILTNIAELYEINLEDYLLAGIRTPFAKAKYRMDQKFRDAIDTHVKIINSDNTVCTLDLDKMINIDVSIFNVLAFNNYLSSKELLYKMQEVKNSLTEEYFLNIICKGKIYFLEPSWNVFFTISFLESYKDSIDYDVYSSQLEALEKPKIIHHIGTRKPWLYPDTEHAHYFWDNIRGTELYELALNDQMINITTAYAKKVFFDCNKFLTDKGGW